MGEQEQKINPIEVPMRLDPFDPVEQDAASASGDRDDMQRQMRRAEKPDEQPRE